MMWTGKGVPSREKAIRYQVLGLTHGAKVFVGRDTPTGRWRISRRIDDSAAWEGSFETPEAALATFDAK